MKNNNSQNKKEISQELKIQPEEINTIFYMLDAYEKDWEDEKIRNSCCQLLKKYISEEEYNEISRVSSDDELVENVFKKTAPNIMRIIEQSTENLDSFLIKFKQNPDNIYIGRTLSTSNNKEMLRKIIENRKKIGLNNNETISQFLLSIGDNEYMYQYLKENYQDKDKSFNEGYLGLPSTVLIRLLKDEIKKMKSINYILEKVFNSSNSYLDFNEIHDLKNMIMHIYYLGRDNRFNRNLMSKELCMSKHEQSSPDLEDLDYNPLVIRSLVIEMIKSCTSRIEYGLYSFERLEELPEDLFEAIIKSSFELLQAIDKYIETIMNKTRRKFSNRENGERHTSDISGQDRE